MPSVPKFCSRMRFHYTWSEIMASCILLNECIKVWAWKLVFCDFLNVQFSHEMRLHEFFFIVSEMRKTFQYFVHFWKAKFFYYCSKSLFTFHALARFQLALHLALFYFLFIGKIVTQKLNFEHNFILKNW